MDWATARMLCQGDVASGVPPNSQQLEMSCHSGNTDEEIQNAAIS